MTLQRSCGITNQASCTTRCQADLRWGREPHWEVAISASICPSRQGLPCLSSCGSDLGTLLISGFLGFCGQASSLSKAL